jgi:hypothetical protein
MIGGWEVAMPDDTILKRIRTEYLEMPGLRLTREQAQRLWGVERALCQQVLDTLVDVKFLSLKPNGTYARVIDADRALPARAGLKAERRFERAS